VKGATYLKLEQIGAGGSSKVYRILGPDMKVYALKKIKLKKMDTSSIASYQNEIMLLKKLQGSPHIIKLIAEEADYDRRVMHVVISTIMYSF